MSNFPDTYILTKEEFKEVREFLKMTQPQYANKLGYVSGAVIISFKENGKTPISKKDSIMLKVHYDQMMLARQKTKKVKQHA